MTAPSIPIVFTLPTNGGRDKTLPELMRSMSCKCPAGAVLRPSIPPIPGFNLGDIIADQAKLLSALTAGFSMLAVVMKLITCIIDVLCALMNPFAVIAALIRLFGTCLPDFILLLPQLAIPALIFCLIKIIIAIITFILTTIIPLIQDIIANVQDIIEAVQTGNQHAIQAVAFKITSLIKELMNIVGILAALDAIIEMIKALLGLSLGIPCGGSGGSCGGCGDDQCPPIFENVSLTGSDGFLTSTTVFNGTELNSILRFSSVLRKNDFLALFDFFPSGVDYKTITDIRKVPYYLSCNGDYVVTAIDDNGTLELMKLQSSQHTDGYLSSVYNSRGYKLAVDATGRYARFGTRSAQFSSADGYDNVYLEIMDTDSTGAIKNSGTYLIRSVYDARNVKLDHVSTGAWDIQNVYNPTSGKGSSVVWRKISIPSSAGPSAFTFHINHEELIRRNIIGVGCHPDVRAAVRGAKNRNPDLDVPIPALPDISGAATTAMACITAIAPANVDSQYVIDNYGSIALAAATAGVCVTNALNGLSNDLISYAEVIYPRIFSLDKSLLSSDRSTQFTGGNFVISIIPMDINGGRLANDLPPGIIDVKAFTTFGTLSAVSEILDEYGVSTGEFRALLTSRKIGVAEVTASVAGKFISDFDMTLSTPDYVTRKLTLTFISRVSADVKAKDSTEPLGAAGTGGEK